MPSSTAVRTLIIISTIAIARSVSASPIAASAAPVAVNPTRQFENGPIFKLSASALDDIPDFYRGMDESTLFAASTVPAIQPNSDPVPEPASLLLLGTGLLLVVRLRSSRRSNKPRD